MSAADGATGAIRDALGGLTRDPAAGVEQLDLLPAGGVVVAARGGDDRRAKVDPASVAAVAANATRERKAGRPPGATNLATRDLRRALHAAGLDSVWEMARWALLTPEELAQRLGCSVADAFDRKIGLLDRIAPYQHARLAPTDAAGAAVPMMAMMIGGREATPLNARPPWEHDQLGAFIEHEQNQALGGDAPGASQSTSSQSEEKP